MLTTIVVTWHDDSIDKFGRRKSKMVEVGKRAKRDYFYGGLLNQAMRQYGYTEKQIHQQDYVGPVTFLHKEEPTKTRKTCATCGSIDIKVDAWAMWDEETQQWVLEDTYEHTYCCDCEGQCSIKDEEIKQCSPDPA